jgi:hypothetical protein
MTAETGYERKSDTYLLLGKNRIDCGQQKVPQNRQTTFAITEYRLQIANYDFFN